MNKQKAITKLIFQLSSFLIFQLSSFLLFTAYTTAAQIRIAWDANTEPDLAGYKVYYGTSSRNYGTPIDVGNVTTYTIGNLIAGQIYYMPLQPMIHLIMKVIILMK